MLKNVIFTVSRKKGQILSPIYIFSHIYNFSSFTNIYYFQEALGIMTPAFRAIDAESK